MLDRRTKERISAEETARLMGGNFGQLDLSGSPDLTHPVTEIFELHDRHGFNRIDESGLAGINQLKELLASPPREVVEELARMVYSQYIGEESRESVGRNSDHPAPTDGRLTIYVLEPSDYPINSADPRPIK